MSKQQSVREAVGLITYKEKHRILNDIADSMGKGAKNAKRYAREITALRQLGGDCLILEHLSQRMGESIHDVAGGAFTGHGASTEPVPVPEASPADTACELSEGTPRPDGSGEVLAPIPGASARADSVEQLLAGDVQVEVPALDIDNRPQGELAQ